MFGIRFSVCKVHRLDSVDFDEMYALYRGSHDIERGEFERKTRRKFAEMVLVRRRSGRLVGFYGARANDVELSNGRRERAVYLGQVMIDPQERGAWFTLVPPVIVLLREVIARGGRSVVLWQDMLTVKSFLLVARNTETYHPHPAREMPASLHELRAKVGKAAYGDAFDPETGIVSKGGQRLVTEATLRADKLGDPDIAFYAQANPKHAQGDGLVVVVRLGLFDLVRGLGRSLKRRALTPLLERFRPALPLPRRLRRG